MGAQTDEIQKARRRVDAACDAAQPAPSPQIRAQPPAGHRRGAGPLAPPMPGPSRSSVEYIPPRNPSSGGYPAETSPPPFPSTHDDVGPPGGRLILPRRRWRRPGSPADATSPGTPRPAPHRTRSIKRHIVLRQLAGPSCLNWCPTERFRPSPRTLSHVASLEGEGLPRRSLRRGTPSPGTSPRIRPGWVSG